MSLERPPKKKKFISIVLKIILSVVLVGLVLSKIDFEKVFKLFANINFWYLSGAIVAMFTAQIFGGLRMKYYFTVDGMKFTTFYSICFYFVGSLFNIVLPGGIGGDGYKAYYFQKKFRFPWKRTVMGVIRGRASGLLFLVLFLLVFSYLYHDSLKIKYLDIILMVGLVAVIPSYSLLASFLLKENLKIQLGAMKYSFVVQSFYLVGIYFILQSFGAPSNILGYMVVFLVANIVAIIPISVGGIGLREYTYVTFAGIMLLDKDIGVAASFLFYLIYSAIALLGFVPYLFLNKLDEMQLKIFDYRHSEAYKESHKHIETHDDNSENKDTPEHTGQPS